VIGVVHGAPPEVVAHRHVGALLEAEHVDVEALGLGLVRDVDGDQRDVGDAEVDG
jgi:hypothetical protein